MPVNPKLPISLRVAIFRSELRAAARERRLRAVARASRSLLAPGRWPTPARLRADPLRSGVASGVPAAARLLLADLERSPEARRPGTVAARDRAAALALLATAEDADRRTVDLAVAAYLRGDLDRGPASPELDPSGAADLARRRAAELRAAGHERPVIVATFPGFLANPYAALMERAYAGRGMAALHVFEAAAVDAIVDSAPDAGYRAVVHLNAADRFVRAARSEAEALDASTAAVRRLDAWAGRGVPIIATIHNGPLLGEFRRAAERIVAQAVVDRADLVHVLTATTPALLADWITIDRQRLIHVPHPNYDGAYAPFPGPSAARSRLGLDPRMPWEGGDVVVGLIGTLADRKGALDLLDALPLVPDPLPSGRRLRLVIAGLPSGPRGEDVIRRAMADPRVLARFGFVADDDLPLLVATLDVAIIPYGQLLNSGWMHLALTAGVPVIAPSRGTASEIVRPDALRTFDAGSPGSLAIALRGAEELSTAAAREAARASVRALDPSRLSGILADAILGAAARPRG